MNSNALLKKRGQAALEFIMTYGWAMMVVLVAIGAMSYFGFTNPQKLLPDKCTFGNGLICQDSQITPTSVKVSLYNGLGKTIYSVGAAPDGFGATCTPSVTSPIASMDVDTPQTFNCTFTAGNAPKTGDTKKYKMTITYKRTMTGYEQKSLGEVYGTVQ
jgi:hypothetical protein